MTALENNQRFFPTLKKQATATFLPNNSGYGVAQEYAYDSIGNIASEISHGVVALDMTSGTFTDTGSDKLTKEYVYAKETANTLRSAVSQEIIKDKDGGKIAEKRYLYDGFALGKITKGLVTKQESWLKSGSNEQHVPQSFTYDVYGNILTETDTLGKITTTE